MINKKILTDTYKYYSVDLDKDDISKKSKQLLRQRKIGQKGLFKDQKIFREIVRNIKEYSVIDWTDETACCYEFKILLHKGQDILDDDKGLIKALGGVRNDLRVFISVLEPYYYLFVEETKYVENNDQWLFRTIKLPAQEAVKIIKEVEDCLLLKGYQRLLDDDVETVVPDIETELSELTKATVFDCLFTDVVSLS